LRLDDPPFFAYEEKEKLGLVIIINVSVHPASPYERSPDQLLVAYLGLAWS
jgi:hypothetical protein